MKVQLKFMQNLILSEDGIFPITKDSEGNLLKVKPSTGLSISGTVQGEGKLAGTPSLIIRLAQCNLYCAWKLPDGNLCHCDTNFDKKKEISIENAVKTVKNNLGSLTHIIITGGEPMLQKEALAALTKKLKLETNTYLTLETNGTLFDKRVASNIDLFSISPKLKNANVPSQKRINFETLQSFMDIKNELGKDIQFKFVIASADEENEIKEEFLPKLNLSNSDIFVMPLGTTVKELEQTSLIAFEMAVKNGWRFSPRLHINLFNGTAGV